ncbi:MAG: hypothetical protein AVDCRST_MAG30-3015 [uncultured Solirubrobacteraceae bacterium]|uniref:Uncharacterized protein n=1 Tax=uncultured Solirubrobacteraceae bacterium TaxID=1162706 RepID=A0A6J4TDS7_9ACTN|nr:MAG: hypothetical protein AVDCRST_MAG30-3015 [uncultured Solirubrobacteraceae bacterium]
MPVDGAPLGVQRRRSLAPALAAVVAPEGAARVSPEPRDPRAGPGLGLRRLAARGGLVDRRLDRQVGDLLGRVARERARDLGQLRDGGRHRGRGEEQGEDEEDEAHRLR